MDHGSPEGNYHPDRYSQPVDHNSLAAISNHPVRLSNHRVDSSNSHADNGPLPAHQSTRRLHRGILLQFSNTSPLRSIGAKASARC